MAARHCRKARISAPQSKDRPITIEDQFQLREVGRTIGSLETPVPLVDLNIVERNVSRWQERCDRIGIANRPHIKTHKLAGLAKYQLAQGASGITVQKLGEAEVMADAGISNMLLTFNIMGRHKLERLAALVRRTSIAVVADNAAMLEGLAAAAKSAGRKLEVLVECDTGAGRNGVQTPQAAIDLARRIDSNANLTCAGLMTYPPVGQRMKIAAFLEETLNLARKSGLGLPIVSSGGSPDMWSDDGLDPVTEYRAGTNIYFDRSLEQRGTCSFEDCALTILSTVVSRPASGRAILDAGSKSLTSDMLGMSGYGVLSGYTDAMVYNLSEEHGFLDVSNLSAPPRIGDCVRIIPNHVCPVSNLFDEIVLVRGDTVLGAVKVDARGKMA